MPDYLVACCRLVERRTGIILSDTIVKRLDHVLAARARLLGFRNVESYVATLGSTGAPELLTQVNAARREEFQRLINLFTVSTSALFRYPAQIAFIVERLVPLLDQVLPAEQSINIWSAGCAKGEELFSISMALRDGGWLSPAQPRRLMLLGTDINTDNLDFAQQGAIDLPPYGEVPAPAKAHCTKTPSGLRVAEEIQESVRFEYCNLLDVQLPEAPGGWHIVVCANVLIYFRNQTSDRVVRRICDRLAPTAAIFGGPAEIVSEHVSKEAGLLIEESGVFAYCPTHWGGRITHLSVRKSPRKPHENVLGNVVTATVSAEAPKESAERPRPTWVRPTAQKPDAEDRAPCRTATRAPPDRPGSYRRDTMRARSATSVRKPAANEATQHQADREAELKRALRIASQGDRDAAIDIVRALHQSTPDDPQTARLLALLLLRANRTDDACIALSAAIGVDPLAFDLYFYRGVAHLRRGQVAESVEALRQALFLEPDFTLGRFQFGLALHAAEDFAGAAREYRKAIRGARQGTSVEMEHTPHAAVIEEHWPSDQDIVFLAEQSLQQAEAGKKSRQVACERSGVNNQLSGKGTV